MKKITNYLILIAIGITLFFSVSTVIAHCAEIKKTENEIKSVKLSIEKQKMDNDELSDILSEENRDDFYRVLAEELGYGYIEEKVYVDITGY